jgi:quinol monooxygenase YgiN
MIVVRFKVTCRPDKAEEARAAFADVIAPSRAVPGVISFDIARDLADPSSFVAVEVFEDRAALERQEALPEVTKTLAVLEEALAGAPEATIFYVSSSEPWGG